MNVRPAVCFALVFLVGAARFAAASTAAPRQPEQTCVSATGNVKIEWSSSTASAARVYFRSSNAKQDAYVEMQRSGKGSFRALLPKPAPGTTYIDYRVVSADAKGRVVNRQSGRVSVAADCAAPKLTASESRLASNLVIGATSDATPVPIGFRCDGIAAYISTSGELVSYDACHQATRSAIAANAQPAVKAPQTAAATAAATTPAAKQAGVSAPSASAMGAGVAVPYHHLRPHRAPRPVSPPQPRLQEPVSPSRP